MILVTGASGLVGAHLIQLLSAQGKSVRALYNSTAPTYQLPHVQWHKADILDVIELEAALQGITHVYHCAAVVSFNPKQKKQLHQINIAGTANVVNASLLAEVKKLVYVSSVAALGRPKAETTVNETMYWSQDNSNSEYGKTKYLAEMEVWRGIGEGLDAVIVNPTIILGAGDWSKGSSALFKSAYKEFPWYTNGVTGFNYVVDLVTAMTQLMDSDISGERFIINNDNVVYKDLFTQMANAFGKKPPHKLVTPLIAAIVWRYEALKYFFTGKAPLITKETAKAAQAKVYYDNTKLLKFLPNFKYTPLTAAIATIASGIVERNNVG